MRCGSSGRGIVPYLGLPMWHPCGWYFTSLLLTTTAVLTLLCKLLNRTQAQVCTYVLLDLWMVALLSPLLSGCMYPERGPASGTFDRQPTSRQTLTLLLLVRSPSAWYGARMTTHISS